VQLAYNLLSCSIMKVEKEAIELEDDEEIAKQIGGLSLLDQSAPNLMVRFISDSGTINYQPTEGEKEGTAEDDPRCLRSDAT